MRQRATALVVVLVVVGILWVPPATASEAESETVVIAVGDSSLIAAHAVASEEGGSMVQTGSDEIDPEVKQVLSAQETIGELILVGESSSELESDVEGDFDVSSIEGDSERELLRNVALESWNTSDTVYVTSNADDDHQKIGIALTNGESAPVMDQSIGTDELENTLEELEAEEVITAPGVSQNTKDALSDSYEIDDETLDDSVESLSESYAEESDTVLLVDRAHVHHTQGVVDDETAVLVENDYPLDEWHPTETVYSLGMESVHDTEEISEFGPHLLATDYPYGLVVSEVDQDGSEFNVTMTNVGLGDVVVQDGYSVKAVWTGLIHSSSPSGVVSGSEYQVLHDEDMEPMDEWVVELEADEIDNSGHPELDYYAESPSGGSIGIGGGVDLPFFSNLLPLWQVVLGTTAIGIGLVAASFQLWNMIRE